MAEVRDLAVAGAAGPLRARLYVPEEAARKDGPVLLFFHGGGWVVGDLDTHDAPCRALARAAGIRVLSVDYRLAPEHPWPGPVDDAEAAFLDVAARAGELGVDAGRIAVGGDSAGGHLAAWVALRTAAAGGPAPAFQLLIYPATDFVGDHGSTATFAEGFLLTKASMDWYEARFVPGAADKAAASPLLAAPAAGLAPAMIVTAGFDPLRDEGEAYGASLRAAGVDVLVRRHPGQVHGFVNAQGVGPEPREAVAEMGALLRRALGVAPQP
jgi:acetyl esterase